MSLELLHRGGAKLALHGWSCPSPVAVLFYVHGTQSHAGWLFETGPRLAAADIAVWALDRRGSGHSDGVRGDAADYRDWVDDYRAALELVRERSAGIPLSILGQSLGGCIATALAVETPALHDALLLSGPAFDLLEGNVPAEKIDRIRRLRPPDHFPVKVSDEKYTTDPEMLAFMRADALMARALTGRFLAAQLDLEEHVRTLPEASLPRPSALVLARDDAIIRVPVVRDRFSHLAPGRPIVELSGHEHYLEFSGVRETWWQLVSSFARSAGVSIESAVTG